MTQPVLDITFKGDVAELVKERNIASLMDMTDRSKIGLWAKHGLEEDKTSRTKWEEYYAEAIKLALQVKEAKNDPWAGCSNVKFPLVTVAALNAHALAYPALINGSEVVKCRTIGADPDGKKTDRSLRVGKHMSYQVIEESPWEEQTDTQLLVHYILGTTFKKVARDTKERVNRSEFVMPQDLVVNYYTRDMKTCPRASHYIPMTNNEVVESIQSQIFLDPKDDEEQYQPRPSEAATGAMEEARDKAQLVTPPTVAQLNHLYEQSCWMDLDQDGYDEPYAVTFDRDTGYVYRIMARYYSKDIKRNAEGRVIRIDADNYYVRYTLIPSPDGGFYGVGLGRLLAPLNDAVDTLINQMIDSISQRLRGGGFVGRGVRIKAGQLTFSMGEFKPVDSTGDDIKKNIMPLPTPDFPAAALDLLKFLVDYGERVGSSGDIQVGKLPGQNTKAETASIANENGKLIFNATYKRFWRGMKEEFRKLYVLNSRYLLETESFELEGKAFQVGPEDYAFPEAGIIPAADPNIVSKSDRRQAAILVMQTASSIGWAGHEMDAVIKRLYAAHDIPDIDVIYPGVEKKPPQPNPKMMEVQIKAQREETRKMDIQHKTMLAIGTLKMKAKESHGKVIEMMAKTAKLMKEAHDIDVQQQLQMLELKIKDESERYDDVLQTIDMLMNAIKETDGDNGQGMEGVAGGPGGAGVSKVSKPAAAASA